VSADAPESSLVEVAYARMGADDFFMALDEDCFAIIFTSRFPALT
jgi:hypothetical protein